MVAQKGTFGWGVDRSRFPQRAGFSVARVNVQLGAELPIYCPGSIAGRG
jgi:hypothetical protein